MYICTAESFSIIDFKINNNNKEKRKDLIVIFIKLEVCGNRSIIIFALIFIRPSLFCQAPCLQDYLAQKNRMMILYLIGIQCHHQMMPWTSL